MIKPELQSEVENLRAALREYLPLTSKTKAQALEHQGNKLRIALYQGFRGIRSEKGEVLEEARRRGFRTEVRPSVRQSVDREMAGIRLAGLVRSKKITIRGRRVKLNRQALAVHRELSMRERGKGYLGVSWIFRGWNAAKEPRVTKLEARGRGGDRLARVSIDTVAADATIRVENLVKGVGKAERKHQIAARAVRALNEDIQLYLVKKAAIDIRKSTRKHLRKGARK